ncbi:MAG: MFS transporter [Planctomycetes bacterium]|nr:MFS transporter [Planctomycetota bacterium]
MAAAFGCLFVIGLLDNARAPLFPDVLSGLTLSDAEGAWLFAAASAGGGVGSLLTRLVLARARPRQAMWGGLLVAAAGVHVMGTSRGLPGLVVGSALFGVAFGALSLIQGALIQRGVPPAAQRRAFSGLHSMYGAASLLAPLLVAAGGRLGLDWRGALQLLACAPLALLALTARLGDPPLAPAADPARAAAPAPPGRALLVCLMAAVYVAAELSVSTRLPLHLQRLGWSPDQAALGLSAFFACLLLGRVLLGVVRTTRTHREVLAASAGASFLLAGLGLAAHPTFLCLTGLTMAPFFPTASALVADEFPGAFDRVMSTLLALVCVCVMLTHAGLGALSDAFELRRALWLAPALLLVTLGLVGASAAGRPGPGPGRL